SQLLGAVEAYAKGMKIDMHGIEELARDFDPASLNDPAAVEQLLTQGVFEPKATPEQTQALERLEILLALIEGWVQTVVNGALGDRIPGAAALGETPRRRRATGGPAEQTFATLVGLELRPRKLREAATLWERLTRLSVATPPPRSGSTLICCPEPTISTTRPPSSTARSAATPAESTRRSRSSSATPGVDPTTVLWTADPSLLTAVARCQNYWPRGCGIRAPGSSKATSRTPRRQLPTPTWWCCPTTSSPTRACL